VTDRAWGDKHLRQIRQAASRIGGHLRRTPLLENDISTGLLVKPESLQVTGSFKARGAFNAVFSLLEREPDVAGVVTHSSGNHGQALACAAQTAGLPATIVVPDGVTAAKIEGIDLAVIERSRAEALAVAETAAPGLPDDGLFDGLDDLLRTLPESRRGLPLSMTVGRMHQVKGMATLVEAWAADAALRSRCNLLVIGGDLEHPSNDERRQLDRIDAAVGLADAPSQGLLLAGHRANDTVARWLAAARYGRPGLAAPNGVYVCASMKEEFGIALLEAMATGLAVVAPASGGPATYVEHGVTGFLVDTRDTGELARGISDALDVAEGPFGEENAQRASDMVAGTFTIQAMAATLTGVYRDVAAANDPLEWALSAS